MKGIDPLLGGVLMILLTVAIATIVSGWLTGISETTGTTIRNQTKEQLNCNYASFYIKSVTYNCSDNCSAGNDHNITVEIANSGSIAINIEKVSVINTTGGGFAFDLVRTKFSAGDIKSLVNISRDSCDGINNTIDYVYVGSMNCPNAYDQYPGNLVSFVNC